MHQKTLAQKVQTVYFVAVATLMYYFIDSVLQLSIYISFHHAFALLLILSAFVCFLVRPRLVRAAEAVRAGLVLSVPLLVMVTVSLLIWSVERTAPDLIFRGLSYYLILSNQASGIFAAMAFLYIFGEVGIWYNLLAIVLANLMMIAGIMAEYGIGSYMQQLWTLIITFADQTGDVIVQAEIHELAFCLGAYLLYMLLYPRRSLLFWILLPLAGFCFVSAFKRIAMVAIAVGLALGWLLRLLERLRMCHAVRLVLGAGLILGLLLLVAYVAAVKMGIFTLMEEAGINTNGRADIYEAIDDLYTFSPSFLGRGQGYLTYQLNENRSLGMDAVHNDFLQFYIDLGFWGYLLWLLSFTVLRVWFFGRDGRLDGAVNAFVILLYMLTISSTDNTMNYQLVHGAIALLIAGHGFDDRVRHAEQRFYHGLAPQHRLRPEEVPL